MDKQFLNTFSSPENKKNTAESLFDQLGEYLFEKVVYLNYIYSDFGSGGTTSTSTLNTASRIIDSSSGRFMRAGRKNRFSCQFYTRSSSKLVGYLLSPATLDSDTLGSITSLSSLDSYAGLKFIDSRVYVVTKNSGETSENLTEIDFGFDGASKTFSSTYRLEILYTGRSIQVWINGIYYGDYAFEMQSQTEPVVTYYPFFSAGRSTDGTQVNIVVETLQFIQDKE